MTFKTGTAQTTGDLMGELVEFATRDHGGWRGEVDKARGEMSLHTGDLVFSSTWYPDDRYGDGTFSLHHATGYVADARPDGHEEDSGNGRTTENPVISDPQSESIDTWSGVALPTFFLVTGRAADPHGGNNAYHFTTDSGGAVIGLTSSFIIPSSLPPRASMEIYISQPKSNGTDITTPGRFVEMELKMGASGPLLRFSLPAEDLSLPATLDASTTFGDLDNVQVLPVGDGWFRVVISGVEGTVGPAYFTVEVDATTDHMEYDLYGFRMYSENLLPDSSADNPLLDGRCVAKPGAGPYTYWFFASGARFVTESNFYGLYVVIKSSDGQYRHFGTGRLDQAGTYEGGEFVYGHYQAAGAAVSDSLSTEHSILLDSLFDSAGGAASARAATVRVEDMQEQPTGEVYAVCDQDTTAGNCTGGFRGGIFANPWGMLVGQAGDLMQPMYPIVPVYRAPDYQYGATLLALGKMPGVAGVDITNITEESVRRVGSERWMFFPAAKKTSVSEYGRTDNIGIAYRIDD